MFLRFSKGSYRQGSNYLSTIRKCVFLGNTLVMEYGNKIVGAAWLHEETDKTLDFDVVVASKCELGATRIARYIKNMIGKSNKFTESPTSKKRKYYVEECESDKLPINAKLVLSLTN